MTAAVRANFWICATTTERDGLGTEDGLRDGDIAMVQGQGLYRTSTILASSSTWQVLAGLPVQGVWAMGGRNHTAGPGQARVYSRVAIAFHTPLLAAPTGITITAGANSGWATAPTVVYSDANGFVLEGDSDLVSSGATAWTRGTFTANP
jgi:hypothetical protein